MGSNPDVNQCPLKAPQSGGAILIFLSKSYENGSISTIPVEATIFQFCTILASKIHSREIEDAFKDFLLKIVKRASKKPNLFNNHLVSFPNFSCPEGTHNI